MLNRIYLRERLVQMIRFADPTVYRMDLAQILEFLLEEAEDEGRTENTHITVVQTLAGLIREGSLLWDAGIYSGNSKSLLRYIALRDERKI